MPRTASSELTAQVVGEAVRRARHDTGITQAELARRLDVHPSYIGGVETGRRNLTIGQLGNVAEALQARLVISFEPLADDPLTVDRRR
jgi:transcriptional regulator with XRE-family HTH domain